MLRPTLPLPDHLRANEKGTFTEDSVLRRIPEIAAGAITDNDLEGTHREAVETIIDDVAHGTIRPIDEPLAPDAADWAEYVSEYQGLSWLDAPWFFVETYFYRRLLAAMGYSQSGPRQGLDPFVDQKRQGLAESADLADQLGNTLEDTGALLHASLWSNRVDLSLWRAGGEAADERTANVLGGSSDSRMLVDHSQMVLERTAAGAIAAHFVLDNAGAELVADLALAANLLRDGGRVVFHVKPHPTFVSDVTVPDLEATLRWMRDSETSRNRIAAAIDAATREDRFHIETHPFWVSPLPFWDCPGDLIDRMAEADLVIVKGDANYRRLLGDLHWAVTDPFPSIVRPLQPLVALRTAKSLVAAGIAPEVAATAEATDPEWMTNGDWGMIQFAPEID